MTTFSQIHDNATGYRNDFLELKKLCIQVSNEKAKGEPMVAWFRLRNRRIAQVLEPMKNELQNRIKKESNIEGLEKIKKAKSAIKRNEMSVAQKLVNEQDIDLSNNPDEALNDLNNLERETKKEQDRAATNINYYKKAIQNVDSVINLFTSTKRTKDIDYERFSSAIASINHQKRTLDIDVPDLKELPGTYDKSIIDDLHGKIRAVVSRIDGRYPMKLFSPAIRVNRLIIHAVGNDRGRKAFMNRANELDTHVNEAIDTFNNKYWQITGQRWERISSSGHGYRFVGATHSKVKSI